MTVAAPDLRTSPNKHANLIGEAINMNSAELFGYHVKRAIHILTVAAAKKADILVLGAFGCGAFKNDPNVVAKAYQVAIEVFPKVFEKIEFAVYCSPKDQKIMMHFVMCLVTNENVNIWRQSIENGESDLSLILSV